MTPVVFTAMSCVSAIGRGVEATSTALRDRVSGLRPTDFPGMDPIGHIGRVEGIESIVLPSAVTDFRCRNNQLALCAATLDGMDEAVASARDRYRSDRIAVILGTSTSGIQELERAYAERDVSGRLPNDFRFRETHDVHSPARLLKAVFELDGPAFVISTACSSSANAIGTAARWIGAGIIDAAVVGGADSLCLTTLRGFQSLELLSVDPCQPCGADRKGISIGEAAALILLERCTGRSKGHIGLLGYGSSNDAYHMSTPHPDGTGARLAMLQALESAELDPSDIEYVNFHGTGTQFNDAVEDLAVHAVFGPKTPCSSTKGWSGHTLGTAGALEAIIASICIREGFLPGCINTTKLDPRLRCSILNENRVGPIQRILSNSFGFGGNNCSLVVGALD